MRVNVDLRLKDIPGQLVRALEPISDVDGNIVGVVHHRDVVVADRITVNVTFEVRSEVILQRVLSEWEGRGVDVARLDPLFETFPLEFLLVGKMSPGELKDIGDSLESMRELESLDIRYAGSATSDEKAALVFGKVREREGIEKVEEFLKRRSDETGILVIRGLGD